MSGDAKIKQSELVSILAENMDVFRVEMEAVDRISTKISLKTSRIIRVVLALLTVISLYLMVLTYNMAEDLGDMIDSLSEMYAEFGFMSNAMSQITVHVKSMGQNIQGMPGMAEDMQGLNADVGEMSGSVENIVRDITKMDANVGRIGAGTSEMTYRFNNVEQSVGRMQYDMHNMLRPMNAMPW